MTHLQLQTTEMADIPSLSVRLQRRLSVPAGIEDLSDAEGILLLSESHGADAQYTRYAILKQKPYNFTTNTLKANLSP